MKKILSVSVILIFVLSCSCQKEEESKSGPNASMYKDGTYEGVSRSIYTYEPFYGKSTITISDGWFTEINFTIRDSMLHEYFDGNYEKHYVGIPLYIQQCKNDWAGVQSYPDSLIKYQSIDSVDAVSGATWSYNIFKASTKEALFKAKIE